MSKTRVLVTGVKGYIGNALTFALVNRGYEVVGVDSCIYDNDIPFWSADYKFIKADVRDIQSYKEDLNKADVVIPLAAIVGAPACDKNPKDAVTVNQWAIFNMLKELSPNQHVIYPNTNSGYGATRPGEFATENSPLNPLSIYGRTKCAAEEFVKDHDNHTVFRLATVFGYSRRMRYDLMINDFVARLIHNNHLLIFEPNFRRNFVHVEDVASGFIWAMENKLHGVYNFGYPDANYTKYELARVLAQQTGLNPDLAVSIGEGTDPDKRDYYVSNDKILKTGFKFKWSLTNGGLTKLIVHAKYLPYEKLKQMGNV